MRTRPYRLAYLIAWLWLFASVQEVGAATITGIALKPHDDYVELHFLVKGSEPAWSLQGHRQLLSITLDRTRIAIRSQQVSTPLVAPLTGVSVGAHNDVSLISIAVTGKVDYAATFADHELIVRIARAGAAPDIDAPVRVVRDAPPLVAPISRRRIASVPTPRLEAVAPRRIPTSNSPASPQAQTAAFVPPQPQREQPAPAPHRLSNAIVVIDPGHGGRDPGTESADSIAEKDLALQIALRVHDALEADGVSAPLTRSNDRFLSLAERTQVANHAHADLFLSIHLNSSPDRNTSGLEVYYLNNTTDRATIRLAQMENSAVSGYGDSGSANLNYILDDLRQSDKANESVALARMIETNSAAQVRTETGSRLNMLGVKKGPFYVLVGAKMPAVLVECGFLSNADEAHRLADPRYEQGLADGIAAAVARYLNNDMAVGNL